MYPCEPRASLESMWAPIWVRFESLPRCTQESSIFPLAVWWYSSCTKIQKCTCETLRVDRPATDEVPFRRRRTDLHRGRRFDLSTPLTDCGNPKTPINSGECLLRSSFLASWVFLLDFYSVSRWIIMIYDGGDNRGDEERWKQDITLNVFLYFVFWKTTAFLDLNIGSSMASWKCPPR